MVDCVTVRLDSEKPFEPSTAAETYAPGKQIATQNAARTLLNLLPNLQILEPAWTSFQQVDLLNPQNHAQQTASPGTVL